MLRRPPLHDTELENVELSETLLKARLRKPFGRPKRSASNMYRSVTGNQSRCSSLNTLVRELQASHYGYHYIERIARGLMKMFQAISRLDMDSMHLRLRATG